VLISLKLALLTIRATLPRVIPVVCAISSWSHPLQKAGGQAWRLKRMIMFRLALWRALISEIQELIICCITLIFVAELVLSTYIPGLGSIQPALVLRARISLLSV